MATVIIPAALRKYTNQNDRLVICAQNVSDVIAGLASCYPGIRPHLINVDGKTPSFISIFVDNHDVRYLQKDETLVNDESVVCIVPAIAGG